MQKLWDFSLNSMYLCTQDAFVDSPSREQQQWMGDARYIAVFNAYLCGDMRILRKILYQFAQSQDYEGMTCSRYPDENINLAPIPSYCLQWIGAFWDYYNFTGDLKPVNDLYDHMIRAMRWFTAFQKDDGLIWDNPYWEFYDTGTNKDGKPGDFFGPCATGVDNLMLLEAAALRSRFGGLLGDSEAEEFYKDFHDRLAASIHKNFWSEEKGCLVDSLRGNHVKSDSVSEIVNILALLHLYESESREADLIYKNVFTPENAPEKLVRLSVYAMFLFIRGLSKHKKYKAAYTQTLDKYTEMLESDLCTDTVWEHWNLFSYSEDGKINGQSSACHAWGSCGILLAAELFCGLEYKNGKPVLIDNIPLKEIGIPDFEATLELPRHNADNGYRLKCTYKDGVLSRDLKAVRL